MSIWGKLIGGAMGFAMGGPIGALVGALSGHMVDRLREGAAPGGGDPRQADFVIGVIALGAKLAKADGVVTREEVDAFKRIFHIPGADMAEVARVYDEARRTATGFEPYAEQLADLFCDRPAALEQILEALYAIAAADGEVHRAERAFLERVAEIFGLDAATVRRIEARRAPEEDIDPYEALGVASDAPDAEIKARHRRLVMENHPDRLIAQGVPPEFIDRANAKLAAINAAWDSIRARRGID